MSHDNQVPRESDDAEQREIAERIQYTQKFERILNEIKKNLLERLNHDEKNVPYQDRPSSWKDLVAEVIYDTIRKEMPFEERGEWIEKIKEKISSTENEFLQQQGRHIREGHEQTVDSGMFYQKIR